MPKSYTEQERAYIKSRLKEEAGKCLEKYGIRKTTVDELVNRVKIPKGTFYLFYPSKEQLFFEVILEQHEILEQKLTKTVEQFDFSTATREQLTDLLFHFYKSTEGIPILKMLHSGEMELLARRLPPDVLEEHMGHDQEMIHQIFQALPGKPGRDPEVFGAAFRAVFLMTLQKEEIGEAVFDEALRLILNGLAEQML